MSSPRRASFSSMIERISRSANAIPGSAILAMWSTRSSAHSPFLYAFAQFPAPSAAEVSALIRIAGRIPYTLMMRSP